MTLRSYSSAWIARRRILPGTCAALLVVLLGSGCGNSTSSGGFRLPAGDLNASDSGTAVLFVTEAGRTDSAGQRVAGNRVSGYRLGSDGLLPLAPFTSATTAENPRRLILTQQCVAGTPVSRLYVASLNRVQVYAVDTSGVIQPEPLSETAPEEKADGVDIAIANGHLYLAAQGASRVDAYTVTPTGELPSSPTSCARGPTIAAYATLAAARSFLIAGGVGSLDSFRLSAGELPNAQCVTNAITERVGSTTIPKALDMALSGSTLFVAEEGSRNIFSFDVGEDGSLPLDPSSETARIELFERILLDGTRIYASAFSAGQVMAFELDGNLLPAAAFSQTSADPDTMPVGLLRHNDYLYVAQGGIDRIDAFAVAQEDGSLSSTPVSSTEPVAFSFPNDLAVGTFPPPPCP